MDCRKMLLKLTKDELNIIAKKLHIKNYSKLRKESLVNFIMENFKKKEIKSVLELSWWKKYHNHIYGFITILGVILTLLFHFQADRNKVIINDAPNFKYPPPPFPVNSSPLFLKAKLPTLAKSNSTMVKKIILITNDSFQVIEVKEANLKIDISQKREMALGMIFLNGSNQLIGNMSFITSHGYFNILPLTKIIGDEINLGQLFFKTDLYGEKIALSEKNLIKENDIISLSEEEKEIVFAISKTLRAFIKDLDADNNGIIDFLENKFYQLSFQYHLEAGMVPEYQKNDGAFKAINFDIVRLNGFYTRLSRDRTYMPSRNYEVNFPDTWCNTWPHGFVETNHYTQNNNGLDEGTHYPTDGRYEVIVNDDIGESYVVNFSVLGQCENLKFALIPTPTYYVENGMLRKIKWKWLFLDNLKGPYIEPDVFIYNLSIQISDNTSGSNGRIYNSYGESQKFKWEGTFLTGVEREHILGRNDVPWIDCDRIDFAYNEKFGLNHIVVQFKRRTPGN